MNNNNHIESKKERSQEFDMASQPNMLYHDACIIIEQAKAVAFKAVNDTLIKRNWLLGMRIQHEVLKVKFQCLIFAFFMVKYRKTKEFSPMADEVVYKKMTRKADKGLATKQHWT